MLSHLPVLLNQIIFIGSLFIYVTHFLFPTMSLDKFFSFFNVFLNLSLFSPMIIKQVYFYLQASLGRFHIPSKVEMRIFLLETKCFLPLFPLFDHKFVIISETSIFLCQNQIINSSLFNFNCIKIQIQYA